MSTLASAALALAMICAALLALAGSRLLRNPDNRRKGWLMIAAALVLVGNVLILTI